MVVVVLEMEKWVPFPPKKKWIRHYLEEYPHSEKNFSPESASSMASSAVRTPMANSPVPCQPADTDSSHDVISSTDTSFSFLNDSSCTSSSTVTAIPSFSLTPSLSFNYSTAPIDDQTEATSNLPQTHVPMRLVTRAAALSPRHLQQPTVIEHINDPFMSDAIHHAFPQQSNATALTAVTTLPHRTHPEKSNIGAEVKRKLSSSGTREVHNKLEKNRRAHLRECFELLKCEVPAIQDEKKPSNLTILRTAIRYVQILRRREQDLEHELKRLASEKMAHTQRLSTLKKELSAQWDHIDFNSLIPDSIELTTVVDTRENGADYNRDYENEKMGMSDMDDGSSHVKSRGDTYYESSSPTGSCSISPSHISSLNVNASTLPDTLSPQIHIAESASMTFDKLSTSVVSPIHFFSASALRMLADSQQQPISLIQHDGGDRLSESATLPKMAVHSENTFTTFSDSFQKVNATASNSCSGVVSPSNTSSSISSTRLIGSFPTQYSSGLSVPAAAFSMNHENVSSLPKKSNFTQSTLNGDVITTSTAGDRVCSSFANTVLVYSNAENLVDHSFVSTPLSLNPMLTSTSSSHLPTHMLSSPHLLKSMSRFQSINGHPAVVVVNSSIATSK